MVICYAQIIIIVILIKRAKCGLHFLQSLPVLHRPQKTEPSIYHLFKKTKFLTKITLKIIKQ